ncbi:hypothetical protein [Acinetobacter sp. ANC 3813]|uniref:hypothetical protein n=1 Tax=Acinetobacter sp. ANC 3813 TaxID=1977873 RepID=UPI000A33971A|nr:hypothetical protein [Acinetobacter sp. ANC 3813]OTG87908.1 hypothetical protein B9T34_16375 [Acinetobacter sp. ANC 3813]
MMIFILYFWLFTDYDIPFVSVYGLANLVVCGLYAGLYVGVISTLKRIFKDSVKEYTHMIFMDIFFITAAKLLYKNMLLVLGLGFDQTQDLDDILYISFMFYLIVFRVPSWRVV